MTCLARKSVCQHKSARHAYEADWAAECAFAWESGKGYPLNAIVRPSESSGYEAKATTAGQSGANEPKWRGKGVGDTVTDGSVVWTMQRTSADSLEKTIASSLWEAPAGVTVDDDEIIDTDGNARTRAYFACTTPGEYEVVNTVTFSDGSVGVAIFDLEVEE